MAKALGIGGIFFKCQDPKKLAAWYQQWLNMPLKILAVYISPPIKCRQNHTPSSLHSPPQGMPQT
jgi:hypothetical protein